MSIRQGFFGFWILGILFLHAFAQAADDDREILSRSVYKGSISGWKVEMVRTLSYNGKNQYSLRSEAKNMFASVLENSDFALKNQHILPLTYEYDRRVFGRHANEKIHFDWNALSALYTRSDRKQNNTEHSLQEHILDPALYQLALQADLANGVADLNYTFIKRKRVETYQFQLLTQEKFQLQKKSYEALVLMREDKEKQKTTKVWVLPQLDYQVGKIEHTDGDDTYQVTLASYKGDSERLQAFYKQLLRTPPK